LVRKFISRFAIASLVAVPLAAAALIVPAGASGAHFTVLSSHSLVRPDQPNTDINGTGATAVFAPKKLTVAEDTVNGCPSGGTFVSFTITNNETKTTYVYYSGSLAFKLKKQSEYDICVSGFGAGTKATLVLGSKTGTLYSGKLKLTFSD
jgi:hypothetical protein